MLFSSFVFLFGFLPIALVLTYSAGRHNTLAKLTLALLSLGFYAWWRPIYLPLLIGSIIFNFVVGDLIQRAYAQEQSKKVTFWLMVGVVTDLAMLGWFKYANFVVDNFNDLLSTHVELKKIALPLAISFYTFQKIAYLVDSSRGDAKKMSFLDFGLFASFFPQLISGPIVHYKEIVPQLQNRLFGRLIWRNILVGLVITSIGLFKKTVIADTLAVYANALFAKADGHHVVSFASGWLSAITYTFQLYFDFSGYSDMAIGLARMFGVRLPLNFHSPLRASNITNYWRRWHMTLQRFILDYLFQPLGLFLTRWTAMRGMKGWGAFFISVVLPTLITFIAVGAWHGAGWTYIFFGLMHAVYISTFEIYREWRGRRRRRLRKLGITTKEPKTVERLWGHILTLIAVLFANVLFRSPHLGNAVSIWAGMIGLSHPLTVSQPALDWGLSSSILLSIILVFFMPNTQQIMGRFNPAYNWHEWRDVAKPMLDWQWKPSAVGLVFVGVILFFGVMFIQRGQAIFLYFNF